MTSSASITAITLSLLSALFSFVYFFGPVCDFATLQTRTHMEPFRLGFKILRSFIKEPTKNSKQHARSHLHSRRTGKLPPPVQSFLVFVREPSHVLCVSLRFPPPLSSPLPAFLSPLKPPAVCLSLRCSRGSALPRSAARWGRGGRARGQGGRGAVRGAWSSPSIDR